MKKGVSAIIATVLLLTITIAMAGTAYVYISGFLGGKTAKVISILDAACIVGLGPGGKGNITLVISNDGVKTIDNSAAGEEDLTIVIDGQDKTDTFEDTNGNTAYTIPPHDTIVLTSDNNGNSYSSGTHNLLVVSPSNSMRQTIYC